MNSMLTRKVIGSLNVGIKRCVVHKAESWWTLAICGKASVHYIESSWHRRWSKVTCKRCLKRKK